MTFEKIVLAVSKLIYDIFKLKNNLKINQIVIHLCVVTIKVTLLFFSMKYKSYFTVLNL